MEVLKTSFQIPACQVSSWSANAKAHVAWLGARPWVIEECIHGVTGSAAFPSAGSRAPLAIVNYFTLPAPFAVGANAGLRGRRLNTRLAGDTQCYRPNA